MQRLMLLLSLPLASCEGAGVDWHGKDAWRNCAPVIDAWRPNDATPPCSAMHMCGNEAPLGVAQRRRLDEMIAAARPQCAPL